MDKTFKQRLEILPIKNIEHPVGNTKYYAAVHVKSLIAQADEEFQELKEQHGNQAESILLMLDEIKSLKSQLQHQALPVVPECVAEFIKGYDDIQETSMLCVMKDFVDSKYFGAFCEIPDDLEKYGRWDDMLYKAIRFGYQVEKPQLFYLKNKIELEDVGSDLIGHLNLFLTNDGYLTKNINCAKKFTQKEIDSMETGSYEQIEVAE
ncbi:DUF1642 domain-containing protein [Lactococcus lactis subsp. lactis]|uniref:DUF1642 domain-containing protein n=1 Tax=Lactococcus lactis TaxID=1358 RepID=UPI001F0E7851|nr:DUF1642 domain-containing protein [Lactococcus lactis]MCH5425291.1 DUF1642 domain-containing protein [Lactococcus lactis]MCT0030154.1 DUF1642 domain-containing protein [Lactococcus lactis subsp. lactis]MCT0058555.1 DUF1642 domain-containing protein [Lactococcus lactis subsp. lactis]